MKNFTFNSLKKELSLQVQSMKKESLNRNGNTLKELSKTLLCFSMFLLFSIQSQASHMMGADMTFKLVSQTATTYTYDIYTTLYRDCSGIDFFPDTMRVTGGGIYYKTGFKLQSYTPAVEVTPICVPPDVLVKPQTNCYAPNTPPVPPDNIKGVQRRVFKNTFVLQKNTGSYIFSYRECCRNGISTIVGSPQLYVQCVLSTDFGYADNSPVFTTPPIPYWCKFSEQTYNHGTIDSFDPPTINIGGKIVALDSFAYITYTPWYDQNATSVPQAVQGINQEVTFVSGINATDFLHTTSGVTIDPKTGSITCTPAVTETAIMAMRVEEWRAIPTPGGGYTRTRIGHITRDIQFTIAEQCKPIQNKGVQEDSLIGSNKVSATEVDVCGKTYVEGVIKIVGSPGTDLKFETRPQYIHVPSPTLVSNFRYTVTKQTTPPVDTLFINYKFDSSAQDFGNDYFSFITYYCTSTGIKVIRTYTITFHFTSAVRVKEPKLYYCRGGAPVRCHATGVSPGGAYTWYPTKGIVGASGPDSSWVDIAPDSARNYWVRGKSGIDSTKSCTVVDSTYVIVLDSFKYTLTPTTANLCYNDTVKIKINPQITDTPYTFVWSDPYTSSMYDPLTNQPSTSSQNPVIRAYGSGDYNVSITSRYNCTLKSKVSINVQGLRMNNIAKSEKSIMCPGDTTKLWVTVRPEKVGISFFPTLPTTSTYSMTPPSPQQYYPLTINPPSAANAYPNPFATNGLGGSSITRVIYTQADLLAMGATAGVIKSISFQIRDLSYALIDEYSIYAAGLSPSTLNASPYNLGSLYQVFSPKQVTLTPTTKFVFDKPLDWDGVSNLMFEFHAYKTTNVLNTNTFVASGTPGSSRVAYKFSNTAGVRAEANTGAFTVATPGTLRTIPLLTIEMARIDSSSTTFLNTTWLPTANVLQYANPIARGTGNQVDTMFTAITGTAQCSDTASVIVRPDNSFKVVGKGDTVVCLSSSSPSIPLSAIITSSGTPTITWSSIPVDPSMTVTNQANITVSPTKGVWKYIVKSSLPPCTAIDTVYVTVDDSLHIDLKIDSPKCTSNTGKLTAILPAASTPNQYNYTWTPNPSSSTNDTLKNVGAGIYTLSVTLKANSLCGGSVRKTVSPTTINIPVNILSSGINCFGGTADSIYAIANSTQSPGPYSYSWSPGGATTSKITNKPTGLYTVTVTDNITLCKGISNFNLTQPQKLVAIPTSVAVKCKGEQNGSINISPTGGTPFYSYAWTSIEGSNPNFTSSFADALFADSFALVVTDVNGCKDSTGIRVNEPALALGLTLAGVNATTVGGSDGRVIGTATGGNPNYKFSWSNSVIQNNVTSTDSIVGLPKGTYSLTVTDAKGCKTINSTPILDIVCNMKAYTTIDNVKCFGDASGKINISAIDSFNYPTTAWYRYIISPIGGAKFDSMQVAAPYPTGSHTFTSLKAGRYNIQVKTDKGCDTTFENIDITSNPEMFITTTFKKQPSCKGYSDGELHVAVTGDTLKPFTYQFDPAIGYTPDSFSKNLKSGKGQTLLIKDRLGCIKTYTFDIDTPVGVTTSFTLTDSVACFDMTNAAGLVTVLPANPLKPYIYSYKPGSDQNNSSNLVKNVGAITDSVVILYTCDTCSKSCRAVQYFQITEPAKLSLTTASTDAKCSYILDGTITATPTGGNGGNNFSLKNFYSNTTVKPAQVSPSFTGLDSGKLKVYVVDRKGCIDSNDVTINKPDSFKVFLDVVDAPCPEVSTGKVNVSLIQGGNTTTNYSYNWSKTNQGGQIDNVGTSNSITNAQGLNTYNLTLTDAKGCIAKNNIFVDTLYTLQISSVKIDSAKCFGGTDGRIEITKMYPSIAPLPFTYNWSNQAQSNPIQGGKGSYTATVTDGNGCKATGVYAIEQPADILIQGTVLHSSCFNSNDGSVKLNISGGHGPYVSQWSTNPTQFTDSAVDLPAGSNTVVVTDAYSCIKNASFIVQQPKSLIANMVDVKDITCNAAKDGSMAVKVTGGVYKYHYAWNNVSSTDSAIKNLSPSNRYTVTVTDNNGCTITASSPLVEPLKLEFDTIKVKDVSCPNYSDGTIDINAKGGTISASKQYEYSIDGGNTYVVGNKFPNLPGAIYNVSVRDNNNCIAVRKVELKSPEELFIQAKRKATDSIKMGSSDTIYFSKTTSSGVIPVINSVQWSPNNGLACNVCESTQVTPFVTTQYNLEVRYYDNCLVTSSVIVPVLPSMDIFVPSAFSPGNQDLVNDVLYVYGNGIKTVVFRVYNRWGEKVFESNSMKNGWDGKYKGENAPNGVYSYQVQVEYLNGETKNKQGSITLIR